MVDKLFVFIMLFTVGGIVIAESSFPPHSGDSPWSFTIVAEPSDTFIVNDTDSTTIDQERFSRDGDGSIYINVPIRRYVGKTDANGFLLNVDELVANGIVSRTATISMPAFDVDDDPSLVNDFFDCDGDGEVDENLTYEVDEVFLNNEKIGVLTGDSQVWILNTFTIDITKIKFPSVPGETTINQFRIDIDVVNANEVVLSSGAVGCDSGWSTAIDWIGVQYEAASPVVLVHGINSAGAAFANFQEGLNERFLVSDASLNLIDVPTPNPLPAGCPNIEYNNSIQNNIAQLRDLMPEEPQISIPKIAELYGTDSIHLVAHSKGGLDSRGFISSLADMPLSISLGSMGGQPVKRDLETLSLVTLNTPHQGSVLAVYGVEARQLSIFQAIRKGVTTLLPAKVLEGSYYCDLTPTRARAFIASTTLPNGVETASVATNADLDGDLKLTSSNSMGIDEGAGFDINDNFKDATLIANQLYQLTGSVANVVVTVTPGFPFDNIDVDPIPTTSFQTNDAIVTQQSAGLYQLYVIDGAHHLNVHSTKNAKTIATDAQQESGKINWRLR